MMLSLLRTRREKSETEKKKRKDVKGKRFTATDVKTIETGGITVLESLLRHRTAFSRFPERHLCTQTHTAVSVSPSLQMFRHLEDSRFYRPDNV